MADKKAGKNVDSKNWTTGLVLFGILHIIIGSSCALGIPFESDYLII